MNIWIISKYRDLIFHWTGRTLPVLAILAFASLIAEYGFYLSKDFHEVVVQLNFIVLYGFVIQAFLRFISVKSPFIYLKTHIPELIIFVLILFHLLFPSNVQAIVTAVNPSLTPEMIAGIYIILTQLFLLMAFLLSTLQGSRKVMSLRIEPSKLIVLSFAFLIIGGTGLLLLPKCSTGNNLPLIDALFTSASAVCVTGLVVVDTATHFTVTGQTVILLLIQLGGLGIMTLTSFFAYLMGSATNLREYSHLQVLLGQESFGAIKRTIIGIALFTLVAESIGAVTIYFSLESALFQSNIDKIGYAIFHSVSAFCNAGFCLTTGNFADQPFFSNFNIQFIVMGLIITGGLGYPVVSNVGSFFMPRKKFLPKRRLSVHSKIVLLTSAILILAGAAGIWILEGENALDTQSYGEQIISSLFQSVSARTAGFNTFDIGRVSVATLFLIIFLMWVGASPGSTGGGIKTTTLFLSLYNISAIIRGRTHIEVFRKQIAEIAVVRAFSTIVLSIFFIGTATFLLVLIEPFSLERILFEVVSAVGTVGYSTGITPHLSGAGKLIITVMMFAGRIGFLAVLIALTRRKREGRFNYTQKNVFVT